MAQQPLRVCADPDNLPFSHAPATSAAESTERGMYVELAELVGRKLGRPVEYNWYFTHNQRRALRNTVQKDECDAVFALPASADWRARGVQKSQPFLDVGYAMVTPKGVSFGSLDALKGKRIALQFSTTPHVMFSLLEGYNTAAHRTASEVFAALAKGEADVGFLWGPEAGYENKARYQGRWQVTPVSGHDLAGQVVVGVRAGAEGLKGQVDKALAELQPEIKALAAKYGFPQAEPLSLGTASFTKPNSGLAAGVARQATVVVPASALVWVNTEGAPKPAKPSKTKKAAAVGAAAAGGAAAAAAATPAAAAPADPLVTAGRTRFNDQCSHCHGSDGFSPVRERDVRRLQMRYDAKWQEVAQTTIRNGRTDLGMPSWKDALTDQNIKEILAYLVTIQK